MATTSNKLLKGVRKHPVGTAAVVGGAVVGAVLLGKAVNTVARVATIKVAADAATEVARAVRGPAKRKKPSSARASRTAKVAGRQKTSKS